MPETPVRILHLEDSETDAELVFSELKRSGLPTRRRLAATREGYLAGLEDFAPHLVLADYSLPSYDGLEAFRAARERDPHLPFIFVTGSMGEDLAVESIKNGATDFVLKTSLGRLGHVVKRALKEKADQDEKARLLSDLKALVSALGEIVYEWDAKTDRALWKGDYTRILGYSDAEIGTDLSSWTDRIHPDDFAAVMAEFEAANRERRNFEVSYRFRRRDGSYADMHDRGVNEFDGEGALVRSQGVLRDVTKEAQLRREFLQAQKMEVVGRLAGGVAHDFNNILTAILGFSEFLLGSIPEGDPRRDDAAEIKAAGQRAATLTRQLLTFSRRQVPAPARVDLNRVVAGCLAMLRRVIGEDVAIEWAPHPKECRVLADPGQLEQVLMNLVVNARDAVRSGGRVAIGVAEAELGTEAAGLSRDLKPGRYVTLKVADNGTGMDAETLARLFEPFFTTKESGRGTGLGLSTVRTIVGQSGGAVTVASAPGAGSTFTVWLPAAEARPETEAATSAPRPSRKGTEAVLVLDDDRDVRQVTARVLRQGGYRVLEAASAQEAHRLLAVEKDVALLLSDVVLGDGTNGPELSRSLVRAHPGLKVIFTSGHVDANVSLDDVRAFGRAFLQKPTLPGLLLTTVREVLDSPA